MSGAVEVIYEYQRPQDALITVDGEKLGEALANLGYDPSALVPLAISDLDRTNAIAYYDHQDNIVRLNQRYIVNSFRKFHTRLSHEIDGGLNLWQILSDSSAVQMINPLDWPHLVAPRYATRPFKGSRSRMNDYLLKARKGDLEPSVPLEGQRLRARKHIETLIEKVLFRRAASWLAHEYWHVHRARKDSATCNSAIIVGGMISGIMILKLLDNSSSLVPRVPDVFEPAFLAVLGGVSIGGFLGRTVGVAVAERRAYQAQENNFRHFESCITLNHEVFKTQVVAAH